MSIENATVSDDDPTPYQRLGAWKRALLRENQTRWSTDKYTREGGRVFRMTFETMLPWEESAAPSTMPATGDVAEHHCLCSFDDSPGLVPRDSECSVHGQGTQMPRIKFAAIRVGPLTFIGRRHHNIIQNMAECGYGGAQIQACPQGFVTDQGRFVEREAAAKLALACGQIDALQFHARELFSEDLY